MTYKEKRVRDCESREWGVGRGEINRKENP